MKDIISMWSNTRMIVLTAICAALYAGLMLPFKIAPIIPGFSEIRPGTAIPLTCSLLFGPAAAWGAGIGNVIGDIWGGMIGPGSFFGFIGNFLMAYIPYKFWHILNGKTDIELNSNTVKSVSVFILICITASFACAVFVGWGLDIIKFVPLRMLTNVIAINNSIFTILLGLPLTLALYKRVKQWGLFYADIMKGPQGVTSISRFGALLMIFSTIGGVIAVNTGFTNPGFSVFVLLIIIASFLL
jgi:energy-coupling factor transport system substrate-specific component